MQFIYIYIHHNNHDIQKGKHFKFLGLNIDQHLKWKGNIKIMCGKLDR